MSPGSFRNRLYRNPIKVSVAAADTDKPNQRRINLFFTTPFLLYSCSGVFREDVINERHRSVSLKSGVRDLECDDVHLCLVRYLRSSEKHERMRGSKRNEPLQ
ncbi:hypothetical protein QQF64_021903 [Cirrhinus molitorella]|uniref:Uncharacterized protein n=1 Tax=Cirrhinus molitorella TaxID=172907 RepID=A0ABR3L6M4_9TELE